jgi:hypothetical protein
MSTALDDIVDLIDDAAGQSSFLMFGNQRLRTRHGGRNCAHGGTAAGNCFNPPEAKKHHAASGGDSSTGKRRRRLFHAAIAELFHEENETLTVLKWKEVYEKLEAQSTVARTSPTSLRA